MVAMATAMYFLTYLLLLRLSAFKAAGTLLHAVLLVAGRSMVSSRGQVPSVPPPLLCATLHQEQTVLHSQHRFTDNRNFNKLERQKLERRYAGSRSNTQNCTSSDSL